MARSTKAYQAERGLKTDGHVGLGLDPDDGKDRTEGPTLLSIQSDLRAKRLAAVGKTRPAPNRVVPISRGVGKGQPNKPQDVALVRNSLALAGTYPKNRALKTNATFAQKSTRSSVQNPEDPELTPAILTFQNQHGRKADGVILPNGETQARLGPLVDAKVAAELGDDLQNPAPFKPKPNPPIARTWPDIPTRISVPFGSGMGMNEDDTDHRLALAHAADLRRVNQARLDRNDLKSDTTASPDDPIADHDGDDIVLGGEGSDTFNEKGAPSSQETPSKEIIEVPFGGPRDDPGQHTKRRRAQKEWSPSELEWLNGFLVEHFDRDLDQLQRDLRRTGRHLGRNVEEALSFVVENFGPGADIQEAYDGSAETAYGVQNLDWGQTLKGVAQMLGGILSIPAPGSARKTREATEAIVQAARKNGENKAANNLRANKWGIYGPPKSWKKRGVTADGSERVPSDQRQTDRKSVRSGSTGSERVDLEGRPLTARIVVGRTEASGSERPLTKAALEDVVEATTGQPIKKVEKSTLRMEDSIAEAYLDERGRVNEIVILKDLPPNIRHLTALHELGHVIDEMVETEAFKGIPIDGIGDELKDIYSLGATGKPWKETRFGPEELYDGGTEEHRAEYMAEALRFYMMDPAGMKANAPKTAARIRKWVNDHPELKTVIQFNTIMAAIGAPMFLQENSTDEGGL